MWVVRGDAEDRRRGRRDSINAGFVQHNGIFDIVATVTHHTHHRIVASSQLQSVEHNEGTSETSMMSDVKRGDLVEANEIENLGFDHWFHRVDHEIEKGVDAIELIVRHVAHRLLAHRTLIRVSRALVMMRVWNQACIQPNQHMCSEKIPATQPRMVRGSISTCVVCSRMSFSYIAM